MATETYFDLICTAPADGSGSKVSPDTSGMVLDSGTLGRLDTATLGDYSWYLTVELAIADGGAKVGSAFVGSSWVSEYQWLDLTPEVLGVQYTRGAPSGAQGTPRMDVGTATITLSNNPDAATPNFYSAYNRNLTNYTETGILTSGLNREYTPGALMRICLYKPYATSTVYAKDSDNVTYINRLNWQPLFTGLVETWDESLQIGNQSQITIQLAETVSFFAGVETTAVTPVGAGDIPVQRFNRLATASAWPYGITKTTGWNATKYALTNDEFTLSATDMSMNRLAELYLTGDSIGHHCPVMSARDGSLRIGRISGALDRPAFTSKAYRCTNLEVTVPAMTYHYYAEPFTVTNNPDFVINDVSMNRSGGSAQTQTNTASVAKFGTRSYARSDLICETDAMSAESGNYLLWVYGGIAMSGATVESPDTNLQKMDQTLQPGEIVLHDDWDALARYDIDEPSYVLYWYTASNIVFFNARIQKMTVTLVPASQRVIGTVRYGFHANSARPYDISEL